MHTRYTSFILFAIETNGFLSQPAMALLETKRDQFGCVLQAAGHRWCAAAAERYPEQVQRSNGGRLRGAPPGARLYHGIALTAPSRKVGHGS